MKREIWVDNVKVIACILVVLGHFFQSMTKALILSETDLYMWFNQTIYYFHVPLFFICSGYLYQKYSKVNSISTWENNILKKTLALGVPYFIFSICTWCLKTIFSSSVNGEVGGLFYSLFKEPLSPYWYLYCLFFVFLITPTFCSKKNAYIGLFVAMILKIISIIGVGFSVYAVSSVFANEIWFVLGMCICVFGFNNLADKVPKIVAFGMPIIFVVVSVMVYVFDVDFKGMAFLIGSIGCASVLITISYLYRDNVQNVVMGFMAKYTMPIFLMHTIFAATLRSVLVKVGVEEAFVHVTLGILISFIGPIIAAKVMSCFKWLDFWIYPNKYVKVN